MLIKWQRIRVVLCAEQGKWRLPEWPLLTRPHGCQHLNTSFIFFILFFFSTASHIFTSHGCFFSMYGSRTFCIASSSSSFLFPYSRFRSFAVQKWYFSLAESRRWNMWNDVCVWHGEAVLASVAESHTLLGAQPKIRFFFFGASVCARDFLQTILIIWDFFFFFKVSGRKNQKKQKKNKSKNQGFVEGHWENSLYADKLMQRRVKAEISFWTLVSVRFMLDTLQINRQAFFVKVLFCDFSPAVMSDWNHKAPTQYSCLQTSGAALCANAVKKKNP